MTERTPWIVALGGSGAEGLQDLRSLLAEWRNLDAIVMVVLHRPWGAVTQLRAVLQRVSHMPVVIATDDQQLRSGCVYIGEPGSHLTLVAKSLGGLTDDPLRSHRNRTVDLLFNSLADLGGQRVIGVVLSGSLDDGSRGLAAIHEAGGCTMVINRSDQIWPGMPENAMAYDGPIDFIGDTQAIAQAVQRAVTSAKV
jgi:two-component system, chemotaxis family, protein-glutamate methylesterase/glutaminase